MTFDQIVAEAEATRHQHYAFEWLIDGKPTLLKAPSPPKQGVEVDSWESLKREEQAERANRIAELVAEGKTSDEAIEIIGEAKHVCIAPASLKIFSQIL